ncbi:MAG: CU044_2847 family protein [Solirubrobacterales bacterium]
MAEGIIEVDLPNGAVALAQVARIDGDGAEKTAAVPRFDFEEVTKTLEGISDALKGALAKAAPDKVTVELGIELAVKSGKLTGLLVEGAGKGSLAITLEWAGQAPAAG